MQADLLHPLTSLKWRKCTETPFGFVDAQAVCVNRSVYIGGQSQSPNTINNYTILHYNPAAEFDSWKIIKSPTRYSALTAYQEKLVMIGGVDHAERTTSKLWSLQNDDRWTDELPPMPTPRYGASAVNTGSHLIVAGGTQKFGSALNVVEVFNERQWTRTKSLQKAGWCMKSTLNNGEWYLMGGWGQGKSVFCATVDSLIATAGSSEGEGGSVWKTLPEAPLENSSIAMYENRLLAIGGRGDSLLSGYSRQSAIYGYITGTQSWVHIGNLPEPISSTYSILLPSSELLVVGGVSNSGPSSSVFKATLRVDPFQLDGQFSMAAFSRLQYAVGAPLFSSIGEVFTQSIGMQAESDLEAIGREAMEQWLRGESDEPPTWRSLVEVMTSLPQLAPLAETINRLFVIPLLENRIRELECYLHHHKETIQQLGEERQVALQSEEAVGKEKQLSTHTFLVKLEPGIKQEPEVEPSVKQEVLNDLIPIKKEEEVEEKKDEVEMTIKRVEQMKEAHIMLEEKLAKCQLQKAESEMRCHELQKELQSQLNAAVTDQDTDVESVLAERDRALEERDKLRMELDQKEITSMSFLRGMDVVAETSLEVTSQAHTYHWEGYGMKLHIPQDSLPADCQQCRVEMRASLSGHYMFPVGCELVSGVYWMYCPVKFCKFVTLEVQHCSKQTEGLSFVRANCTQEQLPYTFQSVETGVFSETSSCGSIELSRFSGWGIVDRLMSWFANQNYCAQVFYSRVAHNAWKIHFVITCRRNLDLDDVALRRAMEKTSGNKISAVGSQFPVEFEADSIELKFSKSLSGWRVVGLSHPSISRKDIDSFKYPSGLIPHCQLKVTSVGGEVGSVLEERVYLKGAKEPRNYFLLECGPVGPSSKKRGPPSSQSSGLTTPKAIDKIGGEEAGTSGQPAETAPLNEPGLNDPQSEPLTDPPTFQDLMEEVAACLPEKWADVATKLGLQPHEIKRIKVIPNTTPNDCYREVFSEWKNNTPEPYCWATIMKALRSKLVAKPGLALDIESRIQSSIRN